MANRILRPRERRAPIAKRAPNGFSLIELLAAMAITSTILIASMALYVSALKNTAVNQSQVSANSSARLVMEYVDKDLKQGIVIPCMTGTTGCNADGTVTITSPASAAGTYTPSGDVLVIQMPSWNSALSETINGKYDTVIYQYVQVQTGGGSNHDCYNLRRIVSPDPGSSRVAEDRWLLPYDPNRNALDPAVRRSEPSLEYDTGTTSLFNYYVQQEDASGNATGQTTLRTSEPWKDVVMVETRILVSKTHDASTIKANATTRTRLRNWTPT